jgi:predicted RNA binding protein YcfA (HicA-like mRNA interferase family)
MKGAVSVTFKEIERLILNDGWTLKTVKGSHHHYVHPRKQGKVTIPYHGGDIDMIIIKAIKKQAQI